MQTTVSVLAGFLIEVTRLGGWFQRGFLFVLAPVAASFVHLMLSPSREFAADRAAPRSCESPHGLADALIRLEAGGSFVEFRACPATEPLYTVNPFAEERASRPCSSRIPRSPSGFAACELDPEWRANQEAALVEVAG